jgi:hypothetical protein
MPDLVLTAKNVQVRANEGSSAELRGTAEAVELEATGASQLRLGGLVAESAEVKLRDASHADVHAKAKVTYDLHSGSHLEVLGNPADLDGRSSEGSRVSRKRSE